MSDPVIAIGDVQGCLPSLEALLERLPKDVPLVFVGDLVNRGPDSLGTLRRIISLGDRARCVLGNHDLHLLAVHAGVRRMSRKDTIADILGASDAEDLLDFLRTRPLMIEDEDAVFVHAGVHPTWDVETARSQARLVEERLRSPEWREELFSMYGDADWAPDLPEEKRLQAVLNSFTRIRLVDEKTGVPDYRLKDNPQKTPAGFVPWFDYEHRVKWDKPIVFGHWSTLGLVNRPDVVAIDTGCLWGGSLTAVRLPERSFTVEVCPCYQDPLAY